MIPYNGTGQAGTNSCAFLKDIEGFNRRRLQGSDGRQNFVTLKGLSFSEAYSEGVLWIALQYGTTGAKSEEFSILALVSNNVDVFENMSCFRPGFVPKPKPFYSHFGQCWDQDEVLVGDIEHMQAVEAQSPAFVGLYVVEDFVDDQIAWRNSFLFMSIDGTFKRLPVFAEGKTAKIAKCGTSGIAYDVVRVVKGNPEVVDSITHDSRCVFGERGGTSMLPAFQKAVLALGPQSLHVVTDVSREYDFQLVDVMFGPFNL